jgi:hypothetical protein
MNSVSAMLDDLASAEIELYSRDQVNALASSRPARFHHRCLSFSRRFSRGVSWRCSLKRLPNAITLDKV